MGYERVHMKEEKEDFFQIHNMCIVERTERRRDDEKNRKQQQQHYEAITTKDINLSIY